MLIMFVHTLAYVGFDPTYPKEFTLKDGFWRPLHMTQFHRQPGHALLFTDAGCCRMQEQQLSSESWITSVPGEEMNKLGMQDATWVESYFPGFAVSQKPFLEYVT